MYCLNYNLYFISTKYHSLFQFEKVIDERKRGKSSTFWEGGIQ